MCHGPTSGANFGLVKSNKSCMSKILDPEGNQGTVWKLYSCFSIISLCIDFKIRRAYEINTLFHLLLEVIDFKQQTSVSSLYLARSQAVAKCLVASNHMASSNEKMEIDCQKQSSKKNCYKRAPCGKFERKKRPLIRSGSILA